MKVRTETKTEVKTTTTKKHTAMIEFDAMYVPLSYVTPKLLMESPFPIYPFIFSEKDVIKLRKDGKTVATLPLEFLKES